VFDRQELTIDIKKCKDVIRKGNNCVK